MFNEQELSIINSMNDRGSGLKKLAMSYYDGENGMEKNLQKAAFLACMAAWNGSVAAAGIAGYFYLNGIGVEKDNSEAFLYYLHAAKQGNSEAMYMVGNFYTSSEYSPCICPINMVTGNVWYEKAANKGHVNAMEILGDNYYKGLGVVYDLDKALYWYENAAKAGNVNGMYNTALFYHGGEGIMYEDSNKAGYWLNEAAKRGDKEAQKLLTQYKYSNFSNKWKKISQ